MHLIRRLLGHRDVVAPLPAPIPEPTNVPNLDAAWKQLSLINEWIRHSDAKAGATLAVTGVLATVTFNLSNHLPTRSCWTDSLVIAIGALLLVAGTACGWTLNPRIRDKGANLVVPNRLFFQSIAMNFTRDQYRDALAALLADPDDLLSDLADEVHVNAKIATTKVKSVRWAIRASLAAIALVAVFAVVVGFVGTPLTSP